MTQEEIKALVPGKDFNAAVAEVMGWKDVKEQVIRGYGIPDQIMLIGDRPDGRNDVLPAWSLYDGPSLEVLAEIINRGWTCDISVSPALAEHNELFQCKLNPHPQWDGNIWWKIAKANTLAEALCRAFLLIYWAENE